MGRAVIAVIAVVLAGGCAGSGRLEPASHGAVGAATGNGVVLFADPAAWQGRGPVDLPRYLTPIAVQIVNHSGRALRVNYGDLALVDERGFRYAVINPYPDEAVRPWRARGVPRPALAAVGIAAATSGDLGVPAGPQIAPVAGTRRVVAAARRRVQPVPPPHVLVPGYRFAVHPRERMFFVEFEPWLPADPDPFDPFGDEHFWPRDYREHVFSWDERYYPGRASADVLRWGLPEGVLRVEGRIAGFVYFQNAHASARSLELVFDAHMPSGQPVAAVRIPFLVVP